METKVTEANQTQVPAALRAKHNVGPGDLVVWEEMPDGSVRVRFRRRHTLQDLVGFARGASGDAVDTKRRAQRRRK